MALKSIGTAEQAIAFALTINDHLDMREFLRMWQDGSIAHDDDEFDDYFEWLRQNKAQFTEAANS